MQFAVTTGTEHLQQLATLIIYLIETVYNHLVKGLH